MKSRLANAKARIGITSLPGPSKPSPCFSRLRLTAELCSASWDVPLSFGCCSPSQASLSTGSWETTGQGEEARSLSVCLPAATHENSQQDLQTLSASCDWLVCSSRCTVSAVMQGPCFPARPATSQLLASHSYLLYLAPSDF